MTAARADETFRHHLRDPVQVLDVAHEAAGRRLRCAAIPPFDPAQSRRVQRA